VSHYLGGLNHLADQVRASLDVLGIPVPADMFIEVERDCIHGVGSRVVVYDCDDQIQSATAHH
jgi:hypothetical protein